MNPSVRRELLRKGVHTAVGLLAFLIVFLGPWYSALLALALVFFNLFLLPRISGRLLWRQQEFAHDRGIIAYPIAVLALVVVFWRHLEVAAAVWGILAFGDGMAAIIGILWGRSKLPWNRRKSWAGSLAYWFFGAAGAAALLVWTLTFQGREIALPFLVTAAALAALFAAALESQPQGLDDNLTVPLLAGLVLLGLLQSQGWWSDLRPATLFGAAILGAGVNLALASVAHLVRAVDLSGAVAGGVLGTAIYAFLGWRGFLLLGAFLLLGTAATRLGFARKAEARLAQGGGGRRSARHAVANAGVATLAAVFAATTPHPSIYLAAFAAAFASAAGDTLSSEIGQLWGGRTRLITTFEPVPPGTDGGVSAAGTLAGAAGSLVIAALGFAVGLYPATGVAVVALAGVAGNTADSVLGATLERRGLLDNEGVNFANTLCGALAGAGLAAWIG
jgi:uncharacterized protein (TIGR00297 family)